MASKTKKRGNVVDEHITEDKENSSSRRIGRAKKAVNYCEDTPSRANNKKKVTQKSKTSNKLEKEVLQNAQTNSTRSKKSTKQETEDTSEVSSKTPKTKSKGKQKDANSRKEDVSTISQETTVENKSSRTTGKNDKNSSVASSNNKSHKNPKQEKESARKPNVKSKGKKKDDKTSKEDEAEELQDMETIEDRVPRIEGKNNDSVSVESTPRNKDVKTSARQDKKSKKELLDETKEDKINELNKSGFTQNGNSRKRRHSKRHTGNLEDDESESSIAENCPEEFQVPKSTTKGKNKSKKTKTGKTENMNETFDCAEDLDETAKTLDVTVDPVEKIIETSNERKEDCPKKGKNKNNDTYTMDKIPETPNAASARKTPGKKLQTETPSSEKRVQQVKENLRNSLCGNTPTSTGHGDCACKFTQVYEILELVTDQLADLKNDMENMKSTNESMKTELESSRNDSRRLQEEMRDLKNTTASQMASSTAKLQSSQAKSPTTQNEIEILWQQCDAQKKTIRTLHEEVDNTKQEFNQKLDKFKKAMIFILCKTRPDMKHSDVSKLRDMLSKSEKHLDLTLDEICSSMEFEHPTSAKKQKKIPNVDITQADKDDTMVPEDEDQINGNISRTVKSTPIRDQLTDPFKSSHRIRRTPVGNPSK